MNFFRNLFGKQRKSPPPSEADSPIAPEFADDLRDALDAEQHYLRTGDQTALDTAAAALGRWGVPSTREPFPRRTTRSS